MVCTAMRMCPCTDSDVYTVHWYSDKRLVLMYAHLICLEFRNQYVIDVYPLIPLPFGLNSAII
jgi:hypothetical protein